MAAAKKWGGIDSAFALGFCSQCPYTDVLMDLATNGALNFPPRAHNALILLIGQVDDYFLRQSERDPYGRSVPSPDIMQMSHLQTVCDAIASSQAATAAVAAYRFGAAIGKSLGISQWVRDRTLTEEEHRHAISAVNSIPEEWQCVAKELTDVLDRSTKVSVHSTLLERFPDDKGNIYSFFMRVLDKLKPLNDSQVKSEATPTEESLGTALARGAVDGPQPPDTFVFKNRRCRPLGGKAFNLIEALWRADERVIELDELGDLAWGDREMTVTKNQVHGAQNTANRFFEENRLPFRVRIKDRFVSLESRDSA